MKKYMRMLLCVLVFSATLFGLLLSKDVSISQSQEGVCQKCQQVGSTLKCPGLTPDTTGFAEGNCVRVVYTPQMAEGEELPCFTTFFFDCSSIQIPKPVAGCPIGNSNSH